MIAATCLAVLGVTAGPAAAAIHDELGDAGQSRATAQAIAVNPLTAIRGTVEEMSADMYRVCSTGGAWSATTATASLDPELWLFDAAGNTVAFNDDLQDDAHGHIRESLISGNAAAGTYYLAIAQWPYGFDAHSADSWEMSDPHPGQEYIISDVAYTITVEGLRSCETDAPHITTSATTADGEPYIAGDWTNQDVTVAFACVDNDGGSGVDEDASSLTASRTVSDAGVTAGVASTGDCVDRLANRADPATFGPIKIDKTSPTINTSATTADGAPYTAGDWTNQDVTVAFACVDNDGGSGVDEDASSLTTSRTVSDESTDTVASRGDCVDAAGNRASAAAFGPVRIDTTSPAISVAATTADGAAYAAGTWTNQSVSVAFACADGDGGSGVDASSDLTASQTVGGEGERSVASSGTCADQAGNRAAGVAFGPVKIDTTGPLLAFTGVRTYSADEPIEIGCSASDALSGVATACTGLSAPAHTYAPGSHTISRSATDTAGNQSTASATFVVKATPSSVCALTRQYVQGSARYKALSPAGRQVPDALVASGCQPLAAIVPGTTPQAKAALVLTYKVTVGVLTVGGWLTADQAGELKTLAGAL